MTDNSEVTVRIDMSVLDLVDEPSLDGDLAWSIAQYIKDVDEDVRLTKGKFWNRCKHGTREEICDAMGWSYDSMARFAMYAKEIFLGTEKKVAYGKWQKLMDIGVKKEGRSELIQEIAENDISLSDIPKIARPILDQQLAESLAKTDADTKAYYDNKKKREDKLNASGKRNYVIPPQHKTEPTMEEACNFFGLPIVGWIGTETLNILFRGFSKKYHTDQGGTNGKMVQLNLCHEVLKKIRR